VELVTAVRFRVGVPQVITVLEGVTLRVGGVVLLMTDEVAVAEHPLAEFNAVSVKPPAPFTETDEPLEGPEMPAPAHEYVMPVEGVTIELSVAVVVLQVSVAVGVTDTTGAVVLVTMVICVLPGQEFTVLVNAQVYVPGAVKVATAALRPVAGAGLQVKVMFAEGLVVTVAVCTEVTQVKEAVDCEIVAEGNPESAVTCTVPCVDAEVEQPFTVLVTATV